MNDLKFLRYQREGRIVTLTLDEPETRNVLTGNTAIAEFTRVCAEINADVSVRAVILTASGTVFSAGGNLKAMARHVDEDIDPAETRVEYRDGIQSLTLALYELEVPTIAAVNGAAIGAGCDLACMCDIRIASEKASFAESFVKVGLVPGDGGAWLLPRAVGMSRAAELSFTGDRIDAQQAAAIGLVSRVVPHDSLLMEAQQIASRIAANPGHVLRMTKRLLREGQNSTLRTALEMSAAFQAIAHRTRAHHEAVGALLEGRTPSFEND